MCAACEFVSAFVFLFSHFSDINIDGNLGKRFRSSKFVGL